MPYKDKKKQRKAESKSQRKHYQKMKEQIYAHYGAYCACCGEDIPQFLSIDHINNDGYKLRDSKGRRHGGNYYLKSIIDDGFPDTYQILCMNCNHGKSRNNGICPHKDYN